MGKINGSCVTLNQGKSPLVTGEESMISDSTFWYYLALVCLGLWGGHRFSEELKRRGGGAPIFKCLLFLFYAEVFEYSFGLLARILRHLDPYLYHAFMAKWFWDMRLIPVMLVMAYIIRWSYKQQRRKEPK